MQKIHVALIAPAGFAPDEAAFLRGIARLEAANCVVHNYYVPSQKYQRFGGTDASRVQQLMDASQNPQVDVIMAVRGSYGITRLLDMADWGQLAASNKLWVGYSDVTALHCALMSAGGDGCFAGPMVCDDFSRDDSSQFSLQHFWRCLQQPETTLHINTGAVRADGTALTNPDSTAQLHQAAVAAAPAGAQGASLAAPVAISNAVSTGGASPNPAVQCEGPLWGGNLAMLVSLLGTPYFPHVDGGILFIEDVGEHPYRVERMLLQLMHAGVLARQQALVFGNFTHYRLGQFENGYDFDTMLAFLRQRLPLPIITGLPFGHGKERVTLPLGCTAQLDAGDQHFSLKMRGYRFLDRD